MGPYVTISEQFIHSVILSHHSFLKNYCSVVCVVFQLVFVLRHANSFRCNMLSAVLDM